MRSEAAPEQSYTMLPKMMPFSVDATFTLALMLKKIIHDDTDFYKYFERCFISNHFDLNVLL